MLTNKGPIVLKLCVVRCITCGMKCLSKPALSVKGLKAD
jgi:hypothetical protein